MSIDYQSLAASRQGEFPDYAPVNPLSASGLGGLIVGSNAEKSLHLAPMVALKP